MQVPADGQALRSALDHLAQDVAEHLPAGSSAAGEQPKFVATLEGGQHVIVKFTPPRGTPFGERWHDLLHAECLAGQVLADHGVEVARSRIVESATRTYLVSERFDRVGPTGRLHVVAIFDVHQAFVPGAFHHWAATAAALARQNRLSKLDAERVAALRGFGQLIGNTDMHGGNLALRVSLENLAAARFSLAPVYDMLPMRWRPQDALGWSDYAPFEPDRAALCGPATGPALDFWSRLEAHAGVDRKLRQVAGEMARRVAASLPAA
jgi:serine/threonine protein kinase HipA of HipAB toxin-antitoxin module